MSQKTLIFFSIWVSIFSASVALYLQPNERPQADNYIATIIKREGQSFYRAPFSASWKSIDSDMQLAAGTSISTRANGVLVLKTKYGHILNIDSNSQVVLSGLDSEHKKKTQVFLVNGMISMKPEMKRQAEPTGLLQRVRTTILSRPNLALLTSGREEIESKKVIIVAGQLNLDVTQSKSPVVISSDNDKIDLLTKENSIIASLGNKRIGVIPGNKAFVIPIKSGTLNLSENNENKIIEKLNSFSAQTEREAHESARSQTTELKTTMSKKTLPKMAEQKTISDNKTIQLDAVATETVAVNKIYLPTDLTTTLPVASIRPKKTGDTQAPSKESPALANSLLIQTPKPTPSAQAKQLLLQTGKSQKTIKEESKDGPTLFAYKSLKQNNKQWQLISPKGGSEVLTIDPQNPTKINAVIFRYRYRGPSESKPKMTSLEVFSNVQKDTRILLTPEGMGAYSDVTEFRLSGVQLTHLLSKAKGERRFSFRLVTLLDSNNGEAYSTNPEVIDFKTVEDLEEADYAVVTDNYRNDSTDKDRQPVIFQGTDEIKTDDKIEFFVQSRSALKTLLSQVETGPVTFLKKNSSIPESATGTHFIENSNLIFSVLPAKKTIETLKSSWLSGRKNRVIFDGRIEDFIGPESILQSIRQGSPNQTIQFFTDGGVQQTRVVNLRRWPGAAKRLTEERIALFRTNKTPRNSYLISELAKNVKPPASFARPSTLTHFPTAATLLVDSKGVANITSVAQLGFTSPTLFKNIQSIEFAATLKERKFKVDGTIRDTAVALRLFQVLVESLKINLLMIVSEQPDGDFVGEVLGKTYNDKLATRTFSAKKLSDLQRIFYTIFDYDGIITNAEQRWVNIYSQGNSPARGQWAAIYGKANGSVWMPAIDRNETPTALARCEIVQQQGCWARIFSVEKSVVEENLVGAKSKWL